MLFDQIEKKDWSVWAIVINNFVIDNHTGHPELYINPFPDEIEVSLIQHSKDRGRAQKGNIWTGERFIKNV